MNYTKMELTDQERWCSYTNKTRHVVSHRWDYCQALAKSSSSPVSLHVFEHNNNLVIIPLAERAKEKGRPDLFTPYGFSGFAGNSTYFQSYEFKEHFISTLKKQGYISAYIMQHPQLRLDSLIWRNELACSHQTYSLDLTLPRQVIWEKMSKTHRYEITRTKQYASRNLITDKKILQQAIKFLYPETLKRVTASTAYNFSNTTLNQFIDSPNSLTLGIMENGEVQAVSLFLYSDSIAEYFINASTVSGRSFSKILLWKALLLLKDLNIKIFHLGGGVKPGDSLEAFKRRFGGELAQTQSLQIILNSQVYDDLCRNYNKNDILAVDDFFPSYWKPTRIQSDKHQ